MAEIGLSVRTVNTLEAYDIVCVGELVKKTREELMQLNNFGEQTITECRQILNSMHVPIPNWNKPTRKRKTKPG